MSQNMPGSLVKAHEVQRRLWDQQTHCSKGHLWKDNKVFQKKEGSLHRRCRLCLRESDRRNKKTASVGHDVIKRVVAALHEGQTLSRICGGMQGKTYVGGKLIPLPKLKAFCASNPRLGARIMTRADENREKLYKIVGERRRIIAAPAIMRNDGLDILAAVTKAVAWVAEPIRNDVMSAMFVAAAEGRLKLSEIPGRVRDFVRAKNREDRNSVLNPWGHLSLDKPLLADGIMTLGDTITRGLWQ